MLSLIKRTVLENMTPPMNLLINGDFKINQRGKGSYASNGIEVGLIRLIVGKSVILEIYRLL